MSQSLASAYAQKKSGRCADCEDGSCEMHMAKGGEPAMAKSRYAIDGEADKTKEEDNDIIDKIMRQQYSKGGRVSNDDHGPHDEDLADFSPNEFDDLALRDDLEQHYTGKNSGDEIGDAQEDEDQHDIIGRIMKSRKMKDKMPIGGYGTSYGKYK